LENRSSFTALHDALAKWDGITTGPGRFGAVTFYLGKREVGHVHGESHSDLPFPAKIRNALVETGRAEPRHFLPKSGWVSVSLRDGIEGALELLRKNCDLIAKKKQFAETKEQG
jgi:Family of unknown function (DUF5519)